MICREVRTGIVTYARYKIVVVSSSAVYKRVNVGRVPLCVSSIAIHIIKSFADGFFRWRSLQCFYIRTYVTL